MIDGAEKIIAAVGTALAAILAPIGVIYAASASRSSKAAEATAASLTDELERVKEAREQDRQELEREKASGRRWYQLTLYWFNATHEMRRALLDARQVAESAARVAGTPLPVWNAPVMLPGMTDPVPPAE